MIRVRVGARYRPRCFLSLALPQTPAGSSKCSLTSVHLSGCGQSQLQSQSHHVRPRRRCGCPRRAPKPLTLRPRGPSTLLATAACSRPSRRGSRCSRPGQSTRIGRHCSTHTGPRGAEVQGTAYGRKACGARARDGDGASARDARCVQGKLAVGHLEGDLGVSIAAPAPGSARTH